MSQSSAGLSTTKNQTLPPLAPLSAARRFPVRQRLIRRLRALPILYKVLIANAAVVVLGAVAGTWLTVVTVRRLPDHQAVNLAVWFVLTGIVVSLVVNYLVLRAAFRPLEALTEAARAIGRGDFSARAGTSAFGDPQVSHLAASFNATLDELARDRAQIRSLASQVIRAQEEERRRISRELHDDTAQILFAQLLRLATLKSSPDAGVQQLASSLEEMTAEALEGVRRLALELRPPALDDLGLLAALGDLAQRFTETSGVPVDYQARGARGRMRPEIELVLYRVAQEALTNVAKHAGASRVWLDLERAAGDVTLSVRDDGRGFLRHGSESPDERGLGLGLFGMEERVALVGGTFHIWTRRGRGTEVFAYIPFAEPAG